MINNAAQKEGLKGIAKTVLIGVGITGLNKFLEFMMRQEGRTLPEKIKQATQQAYRIILELSGVRRPPNTAPAGRAPKGVFAEVKEPECPETGTGLNREEGALGLAASLGEGAPTPTTGGAPPTPGEPPTPQTAVRPPSGTSPSDAATPEPSETLTEEPLSAQERDEFFRVLNKVMRATQNLGNYEPLRTLRSGTLLGPTQLPPTPYNTPASPGASPEASDSPAPAPQ